ncbi:MAG: amino acid adenylation domain-containing protein, partial [Bacteroidia bacterium]
MKEFLAELVRKNIHIAVDKGELSVKFPKNKVDKILVEEIKSRKRDILEYLNKLHVYEYLNIPVVDKAASYPLSNVQRRLWVLSQFEESAASYNMPASIVLEKNIDIKSFEIALASAIDRHEILRTVFREAEPGEIRQWILAGEAVGFKLDYRDFRSEEDKEERVNDYIAADSYKAFDLEKGPLFRAALLQVEEARYVFYYNMHHIISDGWSMEVLRRDVFACYEAHRKNTQPQLKELRIQYKDYSAWQLNQLQEETFKTHKDYWLKKLSGDLPLLNLPATKQRPRIKTNNGNGLSTYLDAATTAQLKKYSEANGGSLFMSLLATWNVLLYRYTSQTDLIIGTPVAGREHEDLEDQIGCYLNTLALRNEINPAESFNAFYKEIKNNALESYSHQMYPFDRLVEELNLQRDISRSAVFDVMLTLQNAGENTGTVKIKKEEINEVTDLGYSASKFDIDISVQETEHHLLLQIIYNTDVYEKEMIERLINHYKQLLKVLLENPEETISQIDYLSEEEKQEQLLTFNSTKADYPTGKTIVDLFEEQAAKNPNNIAVVFEEKELSYKTLNEVSNQLAHYLQKNYKIKPDDLISIKQDRSEWMIISILAVLKAGGAYVPIDPEFPQERIDYIESDTKCKVCIDEKELSEFKETQKRYAKKKVVSPLTPTNLANVIYTSGSTGKPKGVMVEHASHVSFISNLDPQFGFGKVQKIAGTTNLTFDISSLEILGSLCTGKELVFLSNEELRDPGKFMDTIERSEVEVLQLTPSRLSQICSGNRKLPNSIRTVLVGGEELNEFLYQQLKNESFESINVYGPTETTIWSSCLKIKSSTKVSIGSPLVNEQIYILNEANKLQAIGVTGEICIGGTGLARGYLNQEEHTKEKFIENPFKKGERIYRTGDLGRWTKDGNIEFVGRKDDQVKIRGYRIELGEIEHVLLKHKQIEEAVVLAKANQHNEKELVAYITSKQEQNASELRNYLKEILPEYMLPAYFVQLEALPLNTSGKTDKKALPDPREMSLKSGSEYTAPRNDAEEKLVKIWEEILQRKHIGIRDDFFVLGGHSLKAVRLSNEYVKEFSVKIPLKDLFAHTTIEQHATLINNSKKEAFVQIEKAAPQESYPISDAQRRLWVLSQFEDATVAYNMPGSLYLKQNIDIELFKKAIDSTITRHEILRTIFKEDESGEIKQYVLKKEDLGFKIDYRDFRKEETKEEKVKEYIQADAQQPFDLVKGPLLRAALLQTGDKEYIFYYNMHHIISDGWSMDVLSRDVFSCYAAYTENKEPALKELVIQYKDYSSWQLSQLKEDTIKVHREYWLNKLQGELPLLDLPTSKQRPRVKTYNGRTLITYLNKDLSQNLKDYSVQRGGTLFMGLLAGLNALLNRYTGQNDLIIGSPIAGREHADLENQIGFYVNTLALRNEIKPEESFDELFATVKQNTLNAYAHQMYPFDRLVEELNLVRDTGRSAVFDVMLLLQNTGENTPAATHREKEQLNEITDLGYSPARFDVEILVQEAGDRLSFSVAYNSDVYEREMIESFVVHYKTLLVKILSAPTQSI